MLEFIDEMYNNTAKKTGFFKHYYTLFALVDGLEAKKTFEFGTGISTKVIVEAIKRTGGYHTSCDVRDLIDTGVHPSFFVDNGDVWNYLQKSSLTITPEEFKEMGPFDFVLHDGSHNAGEVRKDLINILPSMKKNSILLVHDTFNKKYPGMEKAVELALAKVGIASERIILPYSYGLTLVRITDDLGNGTVTPTWSK